MFNCSMADPAYDDTNKLSFNYSLSYNFPVTRYVNEKLRLHTWDVVYCITLLHSCKHETAYFKFFFFSNVALCLQGSLNPGVSREHRLGQVGLGQHYRIPTMDHVVQTCLSLLQWSRISG